MPHRAELPCRLSFGHPKGQGPPWTRSMVLSPTIPARWQWEMREPEPQNCTGWALLHSTFGAPNPGQSGDHYTAVRVPKWPLHPGAKDTHTHQVLSTVGPSHWAGWGPLHTSSSRAG